RTPGTGESPSLLGFGATKCGMRRNLSRRLGCIRSSDALAVSPPQAKSLRTCLVSAAGRVNFGSLASLPARIEQPPRIDEASRDAAHSRATRVKVAPHHQIKVKLHVHRGTADGRIARIVG